MSVLAACAVGVGQEPGTKAGAPGGGPAAAQPGEGGLPVVTRLLVVESCLRSTRTPVFVDPIEHALATGAFAPPTEGQAVPAPEATSADIGIAGEPKAAEARTWRAIEVGTNGRFEDRALAGGYAFVTVESAQRRVVMLEASGHRHVYVAAGNPPAGDELRWEPRVGDIYENGLVRVPIVLEKGSTHLLFRGGRGGLSVKFVDAPERVTIEERDPTLPTILHDEPGIETYLGAVQVTNPSDSAQQNLGIRTTLVGGTARWMKLPTLAPLGVTKVPIEIGTRPFASNPPPDKLTLKVELVGDGTTLHERTFTLDVRSKRDRHVRTFRSDIDGSTQYFAVVPPSGTAPAEGRLAMILSLHGASVEATGQAAAYAPKDWAWIVCPTNRRPYGFDWEDWGRLDAMEVLAEARRLFNPDPRRLYLTGHSMGGHGTWQLAVTYPGLFAAIAPSAGWPDFWSYTGAAEWPGEDDVRKALRRAAAPSRTLGMVERLKDPPTPIYILHGDKDDNVPVEMARLMREKLTAPPAHTDLEYHEQPEAGHWWGNECVDWPALMTFLKSHTLPGAGETGVPEVRICGGGFKDAFRDEPVLVYGTRGSDTETAWGLAKARFDSETFLYRGNASFRVMSDAQFLAEPGTEKINAVLYGNEKTNGAWAKLANTERLSGKLEGTGVAVLAIVPRRGGGGGGGGDRRVGLVGGTDIAGMRLTNQLPYFVSGVGYPEWFVIGPEAALRGVRGVRSAGWFSDIDGGSGR